MSTWSQQKFPRGARRAEPNALGINGPVIACSGPMRAVRVLRCVCSPLVTALAIVVFFVVGSVVLLFDDLGGQTMLALFLLLPFALAALVVLVVLVALHLD
jgi:hypothetical protein